ncbi:hypothetical protein [Thalassococcus sp. S3]|uniref:hypothetical protein n=1 Tax=Thalassococcus sp. S3 TaxID=2017482 RepID=UPI0010245BD8|nr:hypothetical protein [Thalassococcus sp. S3]QBF31265.1 hypothetical protein CFI11_08545 [Thalassococcus sp. S3]
MRIVGSLIALLLAGQAWALPTQSYSRAQTFAVCSGHMSALALHQSKARDAQASLSGALARIFEELAEAVRPDAMADGIQEKDTRFWRNEAWAEVTVLWTQAYLSFDRTTAMRASAQMAERVRGCRALVLGAD